MFKDEMELEEQVVSAQTEECKVLIEKNEVISFFKKLCF